MASKAVAPAKSQVPALVNTPALEIDADDIVLPRLYIGQFMSDAVKQQLVKPGSIFIAAGKDDPEPITLWDIKDDGKKTGPVVHVLSLRRGKSIAEGGELVLFDYNDPEAPPDAWVTYNYMIAIPDVDTEVPFKWLLTRTGKPAAQQINTVIKRNETRAPSWHYAFEVTTAQRENKKGEFFVPRVRKIDATADNVSIATDLALMLSERPDVDSYSNGSEPAI